jgi:hypothetical protein
MTGSTWILSKLAGLPLGLHDGAAVRVASEATGLASGVFTCETFRLTGGAKLLYTLPRLSANIAADPILLPRLTAIYKIILDEFHSTKHAY